MRTMVVSLLRLLNVHVLGSRLKHSISIGVNQRTCMLRVVVIMVCDRQLGVLSHLLNHNLEERMRFWHIIKDIIDQ